MIMEAPQRGKKKGNKRNVDKFNEPIGNLKNMKEKIKSEKKTTNIPCVDMVKTEVNSETEFKKEPCLNPPMNENDSKNPNTVNSKGNDNKQHKSGLLDAGNVAKPSDRPFIDTKPDLVKGSEENADEDDFLSSKIKTENPSEPNMYNPDPSENMMLGLVNPSNNPNQPGNIDPNLQAQPPQQQTQPQQQQQPQPPQPGVQPLASNVINKQPGTMEAQYMQQQSQIFVFSTSLANKSAESVLQGQHQSIISYHCAQPGTKKYLEKHPLKLNQFSRQSPAQWLNNLAQMKQKTVLGSAGSPMMKNMNPMNVGPRGMGGMPGPCDMGGPRPMGPNSMSGPMSDLDGITEHGGDMPLCGNNNQNMDPRHPDFLGGVGPMNSMNMWSQGPMNHNNMQCGGPKPMEREQVNMNKRPHLMDNVNPNSYPGASQLTLTGTKVPTENLTPQQRQHREEQLATLRKMQQMLFPENQTQQTDEFGNIRVAPGPNMNMVPGPPDPNVDPNNQMNRNGPMESNDIKNQMGMKCPNGSNNSNCPINTNAATSCNNTTTTTTATINNNSSNRPVQRPPNGQPVMQMDNSGNPSMVNQPVTMMDTNDSLESLPEHSSMMMQKMVGNNNFSSMAAQMEWQKLQHQFFEEKKKKVCRTESPVPRSCNKMQGPPPPYHQTARSASVPIAVPSPNSGSPTNTTSNLSLPSPRTASDLNSPSELNKMSNCPNSTSKMNSCSPSNNQGSPVCSKLNASNPDTPVPASHSPTQSRKESSQPGLDFANKDLFSRSVASLSQQKHHKQNSSNKEPNLMPVPSPQQIQYLNTFEGQELTIQKQPNTSLKETNITSPLSHTQLPETPKSKTPNGAVNSPHPQVPETSPRFCNMPTSSCNTPTTPASSQSQLPVIPVPKDTNNTVPSSPDASGSNTCRSDNLPLNPNGMSGPPSSKSLHFDPITSLAQMSQQLTSQAAPPCPGPGSMMSFNPSSMHLVGGMGGMENHVGHMGPENPNMMNMHQSNMENMPFVPNNAMMPCTGPMMDMPSNFMNTPSPKPNMGNPQARCGAPPFFGNTGFQRMVIPNSYNGMNVQVKASTPNTIQYLPARPNNSGPNPSARGPPSLDFLQRFANPINNMDSKVSSPMFMPNCHSNPIDGVNAMNQGQGIGNMNCGGPVGPVGSSGGVMMNQPGPVPNMMIGGNMGMNPIVPNVRGQLRPGPGVNMMKVPQMGSGGPVFPQGPGCDPMGVPTGPNNMFIQGSKSSPLGLPPDASQPLPPSMSQNNNFKNSPFIGPTVADPNYAQQFHNFQQQLYATNTRSQLNTHLNQSYFVPK